MKQFIAAITLFTRIPLWRFTSLPEGVFSQIIPFWSITGWITAGVTVAMLYLSALILPYEIALLVAISARLILTGAIHEDGLADFLDGFGGGKNKESILNIMKDSHIGSYGVIGLILYFAFFYSLLHALPIEIAGLAILAGDPFSKAISSMIVNRLPYARKKEESKAQTVYSQMSTKDYFIAIIGGVFALCWLPDYIYAAAVLFPIATWILLTSYMKWKIKGYTGDCCGALFLLTELTFYLSIVIIYQYGIIYH